MQKLSMQGVVLGDEFGTTKKYRTLRVLLSCNDLLIPIFWCVIAPAGDISCGIAHGGSTITETGSASINSAGKISFKTETQLECLSANQSQNTHITLHRSGVCHIRVNRDNPVVENNIGEWLPVKKPFDLVHAFSAPVYTLPTIEKPRSRDAIMPFVDTSKSARVLVDICPKTADSSLPLLNDKVYTFAGLSPHHIVRISIDDHPPTSPTVILRQQMDSLLDVAY